MDVDPNQSIKSKANIIFDEGETVELSTNNLEESGSKLENSSNMQHDNKHRVIKNEELRKYYQLIDMEHINDDASHSQIDHQLFDNKLIRDDEKDKTAAPAEAIDYDPRAHAADGAT